jgi:hypothetical protein
MEPEDSLPHSQEPSIKSTESLAPDLSPLEVKTAIAKFNEYKSPGSDRILAELIQVGGEMLL